MFARVYTAPPPELLYDMYDNEISFDDAAKNLLNKELAEIDDTDMMDELLGAEDPMDILGNDDVEKAIYQISIAQEQGRSPAEITATPFGIGHQQDVLDKLGFDYPGIYAGVEWATMDDHFHDAEDVINDPRAGTAIDHMVDAATSRAEDEGSIESLGDIFKAFGEQLATSAKAASEAHVTSRTVRDPDTGDLFLGPSIGPNTDPGTLNSTAETGEHVATNIAQGTRIMGQGLKGAFDWLKRLQIKPGPGVPIFGLKGTEEEQAMEQLKAMLDTIFVDVREEGENLAGVLLKDLHAITMGLQEPQQLSDLGIGLEMEGEEPGLELDFVATVVMAWMEDKSWEGKVEGVGISEAEVAQIKGEIESVFGTDGTGITSTWETGEWKLTPEEKKAVVLTKEQKARRDERNHTLAIKDLMNENPEWDEEKAEDHLAKMKEEKPKEWELYMAKMESYVPTESEMRARHNLSLSRSFYEVIYAQPWGGRADFQEILPTMLSESKTLFFIEHSIPGVDGLNERYDEEPPKPGEWGAEYKAGDDYKKFVLEYIQNPDIYRKGSRLALKIERINDLFQKKLDEPQEFTPEDGGTWSDDDVKDWAWIYPLFYGDTTNAKTNRYNLIAIVASRGEQGYMGNVLKAGTMRAIQHYENMGLSGSEIFSKMTRIFGETGGQSAQAIPVKEPTGSLYDPSVSGTGYTVRDDTKPIDPSTDPYSWLEKDQQTKAAAERAAKDEAQRVLDEAREKDERDYARGHIYNYYAGDPGSYVSTGTSSADQILNIGNGGPGEIPVSPPASPYANLYSDPMGESTILQRPNSLRDALIHNRLSQGETMQEAIDWVSNELQDFPQQPVDFANPAAFEASLGRGGKAQMLGTGSEGQVVPRVPRPQDVRASDYDMSALRGQVLSPEEIDAILSGEIV
mgnify:CR=1 FL=1